MSEAKLTVGGQAVLEGVMMRSPKCFAVAVRRKAGDLVIREQPWVSKWGHRVGKIPFVRGAMTLVESMSNGYAALRFSADQMEADLAADELAEARERGQEAAYRAAAAKQSERGGSSGAGTRLATLFAVALFIALPQLLAWVVGRWIGHGIGLQHFWFHAITGAFKLTIVLGYLLLLRRIPDIRRVFQYHGAEHKVIATYEANEPLTVEFARKHSTRHARCGTTFLIVVVIVSVFAYAAILPPLLRGITGATAQITAIVLKVLMLPLIAGFAYELQRLGARFSKNPIAAIFLAPGYWVQGITTIEPSDDQLEVALASLRVTLVREAEAQRGTQKVLDGPVVASFSSFASFAESFGGLDARPAM